MFSSIKNKGLGIKSKFKDRTHKVNLPFENFKNGLPGKATIKDSIKKKI